jgi:hypothetical protein
MKDQQFTRIPPEETTEHSTPRAARPRPKTQPQPPADLLVSNATCSSSIKIVHSPSKSLIADSIY